MSYYKNIIGEDNTFYLLVAGSRGFNNYSLLKERLDYFLKNQVDNDIHIVSGGARGADALAERYAKENGYQMHVFPADWNPLVSLLVIAGINKCISLFLNFRKEAVFVFGMENQKGLNIILSCVKSTIPHFVKYYFKLSY